MWCQMNAPSRLTNIFAWVLSAAAAAVFIMFGAKKLLSDPYMVEVFAKVGFGQWFRVLTGALEVGGGLALLVPRFAAPAASMLAVVMVGATIAHLTRLGGSPVPAIVLCLACLTIAWLRRGAMRKPA